MATSTCIIIFLCLAPVMYAMYRGLAVKASFKVWMPNSRLRQRRWIRGVHAPETLQVRNYPVDGNPHRHRPDPYRVVKK
jgi:hypothetical protein